MQYQPELPPAAPADPPEAQVAQRRVHPLLLVALGAAVIAFGLAWLPRMLGPEEPVGSAGPMPMPMPTVGGCKDRARPPAAPVAQAPTAEVPTALMAQGDVQQDADKGQRPKKRKRRAKD